MMTVFRRSRGFRLLLCLLLAALLSAGGFGAGSCEAGVQTLNASGNLNRALSVDPIGKSEGFSAILYNNRNGLPTSEANAIAQTGDGFIWIGSYAGLIRYDGNTFERINAIGGIASVKCLFVDSRDRLWIGSNDNGIAMLDHGELRQWGRVEGLKSIHTRTITEDEAGNIYVTTTCGIAVIDSEGTLRMMEEEAIAETDMQMLRRGSDGLLYGVTDAGDILRIRDGALLSFVSHEENPAGGAGAILSDPEAPGKVYFSGIDSGLYHAAFGERLSDPEPIDIGPLNYVQQMEYIDGSLWLCAVNGIGVLDAEGFHLPDNLPMTNDICHVMTDDTGNLWFTSNRQGVMKIVPNRFTGLFEKYDLPETVVNTTCLLDGKLFVGTDTGLIVLDENGPVTGLPLTKAETASGKALEAGDLIEMLEGCRIRSIIRDSRGRLWISTWRRLGLLRYDSGEVLAFTPEDGLLSNSIRAVAEREDGTLLVALTGGVSIIQEDRVIASRTEADGMVNTETLTVEEGLNGEILLGSNGSGIYIISGDGLRTVSMEDGLPSEIVLRLKRDPKRNIVWIVSSSAIAWMDADGQVTTVEHFPYTNNFDLFENSRGDIWVLSSNGIYVASAEEMLSGGEIHAAFYSMANGLSCVATANSYSELTPEGDLYIAGSNGVCAVNIEQSDSDNIRWKAIVPYVEADGVTLYPDEDGVFSLSTEVQKLTVYPYVLDYSLDNLQVSYRLDGFEEDSVSVSRSELGPVKYTNLGNRSYRFHIQVTDLIAHTGTTETFPIVKGQQVSVETAGSIMINTASLFFLIGILFYTVLYRKRGRLDDRLYFAMVITGIVMAVADILSYLQESSALPLIRELMIAENTIHYLVMGVLPYLFLLYLDFRLHEDQARLRKRKLIWAIPCLILLIVLLINLKTGWIFSIQEDNTWCAGPYEKFIAIPMILYLLLAQIPALKINVRLVFIGVLILGARLASHLWLKGISSTSFMFTLLLVCAHIHAMNRPLTEEKP